MTRKEFRLMKYIAFLTRYLKYLHNLEITGNNYNKKGALYA